MKDFNERTAPNYKLRQDALTVASKQQMARQRIAYRHHHAAQRSMVRTVAIDAALGGAGLTSCIAAVACLVL